LESAFPLQRISKEQLDVWSVLLSGLTEEQFVKGVKKFCLEHPEIYPGTNVVAHIRNYGLGIKKRDYKAEAVVAFNFKRCGYELPVSIDSEIVEKTWTITNRASTGLTEDISWDERRFVDIYCNLVEEM
jgi:hypothetical protein